MNTFAKFYTSVTLGLCLFHFNLLQAQEPIRLTLGDSLPVIRLVDQWDKESPIPPQTEKLMFIADMEASKLVVPYLEKKGDAFLAEKKTVLVSDIHRMPGIITRFVALPKMRDYPFTIKLIREEKWGDPYPRTKGKVTLLTLVAGKVTQIDFTDSEQGVQDFIESPTPVKEVKKKIGK